MTQADLNESLEHYRDLAPRYDRRTRFIDAIRDRTIAALGLQPGQTVLDAGCGTGWCIPRLARLVGSSGRVMAFDPSPEMLAVASGRGTQDSAPPIDLLLATAEDVVLPHPADAILFSYTHDLIRSRTALGNLLRQVRPGARVAATSTKLYAPWLAPMNWYLRVTHRGYITNFEGFEAPWSVLANYLDDFRVQTGPFTQHYVATGRVRSEFSQAA
jgi:demethylmenaquinone methyltransferase/2-methoxy-6-polyprenyl-1,4-benzoquinol methylase